jgi:pSer/pThr/pTyr-binding forkhead associated (FHA) protein
MRDGLTRRVQHSRTTGSGHFLEEHRASLTVLRGTTSGEEVELAKAQLLIGRSPSADFRLEDPSVSHEHALIEVGSDGFGIRDLDSTNGVLVNGETIIAIELEHGDRIELGDYLLQYVVEPRDRIPPSWDLEQSG